MGDGKKNGQIDQRDEFNAVVEEVKQTGCVVRDDGRKNHVFLDHSNICQCGQIDLNAYRSLILR
jgi:hypothetical protein